MALSKTATLRVPTELKDEIIRLAKQRGTTMLSWRHVVTDAVHRLGREQWWTLVRDPATFAAGPAPLDGLSDAEAVSYQAESRRLDATAADGSIR